MHEEIAFETIAGLHEFEIYPMNRVASSIDDLRIRKFFIIGVDFFMAPMILLSARNEK